MLEKRHSCPSLLQGEFSSLFIQSCISTYLYNFCKSIDFFSQIQMETVVSLQHHPKDS